LSAAGPDLRDQLAELEEEHATLLSELRAFESDYLRTVGVVDAEVQELEARILTIVWERSGESSDRIVAMQASDRFRETTTAMRAVPPPPGPKPTDDLKTLFRDAAKRMHPDLVGDPAGREHAEAFMKRLNEAYRAGDGEAIGNLVRQWETSPYASARPVAGAAAPALQAAVTQAEQRLTEARDSDLARLMEQAFAASMAGRDLLGELRQDAEAALGRARARLAELET
jgi:Tfp pilus assembly protein PilE